MVPLAIIDEKNYQNFLEPGHPRIWDDQSNPMDIMGRPGLFLSLLKEGMSASPLASYTHWPFPITTNPDKPPPTPTGKIAPLLDNTDPLRVLTASFPPTISTHGSADILLPLSDSQALKSVLDKLAIANELVAVEGADHSLMPEEARGEEWGKAVAWLERWV
jgi:acetyl esterase/lipase